MVLKPDLTEVSEDFARTTLGLGLHLLMDQTELIPCSLLHETCGPHTKDLCVTSLKNKLTQQQKLGNVFLLTMTSLANLFYLLYCKHASPILYLMPSKII